MRFLFSFKVYENHEFITNYIQLLRIIDQVIEGLSSNASLVKLLSR